MGPSYGEAPAQVEIFQYQSPVNWVSLELKWVSFPDEVGWLSTKCEDQKIQSWVDHRLQFPPRLLLSSHSPFRVGESDASTGGIDFPLSIKQQDSLGSTLILGHLAGMQ